jgi:hypothetical protein
MTEGKPNATHRPTLVTQLPSLPLNRCVLGWGISVSVSIPFDNGVSSESGVRRTADESEDTEGMDGKRLTRQSHWGRRGGVIDVEPCHRRGWESGGGMSFRRVVRWRQRPRREAREAGADTDEGALKSRSNNLAHEPADSEVGEKPLDGGYTPIRCVFTAMTKNSALKI